MLALFSGWRRCRSTLFSWARGRRGSRALEELFTGARGKLMVYVLLQHLSVQVLVDLAAQLERRVALFGRSMSPDTEIASVSAFSIPRRAIRDRGRPEPRRSGPALHQDGSQGEPQAALPRIAIDDHRYRPASAPMTVVVSARAIPGNEKAIRPDDEPCTARRRRQRRRVGREALHVSGHGAVEELKLVLSLVTTEIFRARCTASTGSSLPL